MARFVYRRFTDLCSCLKADLSPPIKERMDTDYSSWARDMIIPRHLSTSGVIFPRFTREKDMGQVQSDTSLRFVLGTFNW